MQTFVLSPIEKTIFLNQKNTFLYKRTYQNTFRISRKSQKINLNFTHPTEWLAFCYKPDANSMFDYERIESIKIFCDGVNIHKQDMDSGYFRLMQKHNFFDNNDNDNVYVYSFCLKAGHGQNSGSINFSQILNKEVEINLKTASNYNGMIYAFASSYNILECDGLSGKSVFY
jgi:hypothetical protein